MGSTPPIDRREPHHRCRDGSRQGHVWGPVYVNLRSGVATGDGTDTLDSIEGATGSDGDDTMIGTGKANSFFFLLGGDGIVHVGGGDDVVVPGSGAQHAVRQRRQGHGWLLRGNGPGPSPPPGTDVSRAEVELSCEWPLFRTPIT